jgi:hypothetical protein
MSLKLKTLLEGYAWERKADGSLPTLKDAIAVHEANKASKPDFLDLDKDGNKSEPMKSAAKSMNEYGEDEFDRSPEMYSGGKSAREGSDHVILDLVSRAEDMVQNLRSNMATNSVLQRAEKMGYLRAYDELLDILSDIGFQSEME